jgi:hypothetical protein
LWIRRRTVEDRHHRAGDRLHPLLEPQERRSVSRVHAADELGRSTPIAMQLQLLTTGVQMEGGARRIDPNASSGKA